MARLDIRDHSARHERAVAEALAITGVETNYRALSEDRSDAPCSPGRSRIRGR